MSVRGEIFSNLKISRLATGDRPGHKDNELPINAPLEYVLSNLKVRVFRHHLLIREWRFHHRIYHLETMIVISLSCAALIAVATFSAFPLVLIASKTSPGCPSAVTCLEKI